MYATIRYDSGFGDQTLFSRLRNFGSGQYWDFINLIWVDNETESTKTYLNEMTDASLESTYYASFEPPAESCLHQIVTLNDNEVLGEELLSVSTEQTLATAPIIIPSMMGAVYSPTVQLGDAIKIVKGDTPTLTGSANANCNGYNIKLVLKMTKPAIKNIEVNAIWDDSFMGKFICPLTSANTATTGIYDAEFKITKDSTILTVLKFKLVII